MPNTVLGKVSITPRGAYSASATYAYLDAVRYNGNAYLVLKEGLKGVTPADGANYMLLVEKGNTGSQGVQGIQGEQGPVYTPSVSDDGDISWTNNGGLANPATVNIRGPQGIQGETGSPGSSIQSIERTAGTGAPGTIDTYTITLTDGSTTDFQVYNGQDGSGAGDFKADGTVPMTGSLQMSGQRITGLAEPVADDDAARKADIPANSVFTVTLPASDWVDNTQTVTNENIFADGYAYGVNAAAGIYADDITVDGEITFHCGTVPVNDLTISILKVEVNE